jgi:hypothetical protein
MTFRIESSPAEIKRNGWLSNRKTSEIGTSTVASSRSPDGVDDRRGVGAATAPPVEACGESLRAAKAARGQGGVDRTRIGSTRA